jgi:hypothetical protein
VALSNSVVLEVDDARGCHLDGTENGNYFKDSVVKARRNKTVIFFVATPKVGAPHKARDIKHNDTLQTW